MGMPYERWYHHFSAAFVTKVDANAGAASIEILMSRCAKVVDARLRANPSNAGYQYLIHAPCNAPTIPAAASSIGDTPSRVDACLPSLSTNFFSSASAMNSPSSTSIGYKVASAMALEAPNTA